MQRYTDTPEGLGRFAQYGSISEHLGSMTVKREHIDGQVQLKLGSDPNHLSEIVLNAKCFDYSGKLKDVLTKAIRRRDYRGLEALYYGATYAIFLDLKPNDTEKKRGVATLYGKFMKHYVRSRFIAEEGNLRVNAKFLEKEALEEASEELYKELINPKIPSDYKEKYVFPALDAVECVWKNDLKPEDLIFSNWCPDQVIAEP